MKTKPVTLFAFIFLLFSAFLQAAETGPLLSTRWNQGCFYNGSCPTDASATGSCLHALAGSGAVAMAQVMKYHNYPVQGTGQHAYNHAVYGNLSVNFSATTYGWTSMPDSLTAANDAVATLVYQCGVAQDMDYSPLRSTSEYGAIESAFKTYFGYSTGIAWRWKDNYTTADWNAMLKAELDAGRPVLYYGDSVGNNGHFFVCDGYQGVDSFHFNWGWGGADDGYYNLSMLTPGNKNFTSNQGALVGIEPATPVPPTLTMDFESIPDFSLIFSPWSVVDLDGNTTYGIEGHSFPHNTDPMAFICFNPDSVVPSMSNDPALQPHSGKRFGACFSSDTPSNNDWFISPKIQLGESPEFSFWVKSYTAAYGLEQYRVAVSITDSLPSSFVFISGSDPLEAQLAWTRKGFNLSNYKNQKVYLAIQCVSSDRFILMIDDLEIKPNSAATLTADFSASKQSVRAGELVTFFDQSSGIPVSWSWTFNGGTPGSSVLQNPVGIRFNSIGTFDVTLTISDGTNSVSETKQDFITVTGFPSSMSMDFDSLADFTTDFESWITYDVGGGNTYGIDGIVFPGEGSPMSYICFNPGNTIPPLENMVAHSGEKLGCSFASMPPKNPNNKWLISPKLSLGTGPTLEFWVQTYNKLYGLEKFNVAVSTTNSNPSSFTPLTISPEEAPDIWTRRSYDLSAYSGQDVYIGFQCVSNETFIFMIDDISITSTSGVGDGGVVTDIHVYPNPASETLTVKFSRTGNEAVSLELVSAFGQTVTSLKIPGDQLQTSIKVAGLSPGLYTLVVTRNDRTTVHKITVIN